jgi:thioredoxin reductase (NADPH)
MPRTTSAFSSSATVGQYARPAGRHNERVTEQPLLLVVHRDRALARGIENELRLRFAPAGFEVRGVSSAIEATGLISSAAAREGQMALLLADQDLSADPDLGINGVSVISSAREIHPEAKTVLLVDHAQMESATDALDAGDLDYFFVKPLRDHREQLLPVVADLVADWQRRAEDAQRGVRVIGDPCAEETIALREFLDQNDIHSRCQDPQLNPEGRELLNDPRVSLPLVVLEDGSTLSRPSSLEVARALGIQTDPRHSSYDLAIVGAGPAGLAAAVYGASEGFQTVLVERLAPGGQAGQSSRIENYLGFPAGVSGSELAQRALRQAHRFKAEIVRPREIVGLEPNGAECTLQLHQHPELSCRAVLIACGVDYRRLEVPGVERLIGRGVSYGASPSDTEALKGKRVAVVGGANSAGQAALHLAERSVFVTLLVRASSLEAGMSHYLSERIAAHHRIEVRTGAEIVAARGQERLEGVEISTSGDARETVEADALSIFIGAVPRTGWLPEAIRRDERGFILSGRDLFDGSDQPAGWPLDRDPYPLETSVPGVFAAGDVRHGSVKRVASAVGEGAMAVQLVHEHLTA